jgi:hypothetical protein
MVDPCLSYLLKPDLNKARVVWGLRSSFENCKRWQRLKLRSNFLCPAFRRGNIDVGL